MISIIDSDVPLSLTDLQSFKAQGEESIGRYLNRRNPSEPKVIKPAEARLFQQVGMRLFLIYEYDGKPSGSALGTLDGEWCANYVPTIGAPADGSAFIAYTVDWDAPESAMPGIRSAFSGFGAAIRPKYQTWSYGSGAVNAELYTAKLITGRWLTCSGGFRGTQEALSSGSYEMRQSLPTDIIGINIDPDSCHVSNSVIGFIPFGPLVA